ncbi:MAG TPA: 50S ribosomal protein L24 [Bryobacteraceae bacterium]|nr:50S ribosomal protein L24 [Bryobacteraceae bacterium]
MATYGMKTKFVRSAGSATNERLKIRLKKDDQVKVIAGRDKGKTGKVISVDRKRGTVLIEGVSMIKRHTHPNPAKQIKGGIAEKESSIAISNVMVLTSGGIPSRIGYRIEGSGASEHRVRIAKKSGEVLDKRG